MVKGYALPYKLDSQYRTAHHGEDVAPTEGGKPVSKIITTQNPEQIQHIFWVLSLGA